MTLKELAEQLNRPVKDVIKSLKQNGFRGIYKDTHVIPDEAVEMVKVTIVDSENTMQSLPSANPESVDQPEAPIQQQEQNTTNDGTALQQLMSASVAIKNEVNNHRNSEIKSDYEKVGAIDAITAMTAYHSGFNQTYQALSELDKQAHQQMMADINNNLAESMDFFAQQANQSYYNLSNRTSDKTGAKDILNMVKNLKY